MEGIINSIMRITIRSKVKEKAIPKPADDGLLEQIRDTKVKMGAIRCCFDLETNFDMIDSYILELDALEKRYSFLIKQAKLNGVVAF